MKASTVTARPPLSDLILAWMNRVNAQPDGRSHVRAAYHCVRALLSVVALLRWPVVWALGQARRRPRPLPTDPLSCDAPGLTKLINTHPVVIMDFFAPWCGPCVLSEPAVHRLASAQQADAFVVARVHATRHRGLAKRHCVERLPTLILLVDGRAVARHTGAMTTADLRGFIAEHRLDNAEGESTDGISAPMPPAT